MKHIAKYALFKKCMQCFTMNNKMDNRCKCCGFMLVGETTEQEYNEILRKLNKQKGD